MIFLKKMAYNINKLFEIAKLLDTKGKYSLSDKVDNFIKTSQSLLPTLPSEYQRLRSRAMMTPRCTYPMIRLGT